jgi:hypothetical protein
VKTLSLSIAFALALFITGCAPTQSYYWTSSDFESARFERDQAECKYLATANTPPLEPYVSSPNAGRSLSSGLGNATSAYTHTAAYYDRINSLTDSCLRAKGYYTTSR